MVFHFLLRAKDKKTKKRRAAMSENDRHAAAGSIVETDECTDHRNDRPMFAMICVNNVNRSTAAHAKLQCAGLRVCSYGAGTVVCLPGKSSDDARRFQFSTPYKTMYQQLKKEDNELFTHNGVLPMLERNITTKKFPERWQKLSNKQLQDIDVVLCLDYRVFLVVLDDIRMRIRFSFKKKYLHVICLETEDTPEQAIHGSVYALELCQELDSIGNRNLTDDRVKGIIEKFEQQHDLQLFYLGLRL